MSFRDGRVPLEGAEAALRRSLVPGTEAERYGRLWRMGQFEEEAGYIFGRIGYETQAGQTERWDPGVKDFVEASIREGYTSRFAIGKRSQRIAFQLRPHAIKPGTFTGAFQSLLHEAAPDLDWEVTGDVAETFEEWATQVDRITRLTITIDRPNPTYKHAIIGSVIEDSKANAFQIGLTARRGEGLDREQDFVRKAIEQATYRGKIAATGETGKGRKAKKAFWRKGAIQRQRSVPKDPSTGEATKQGLKSELDKEGRGES